MDKNKRSNKGNGNKTHKKLMLEITVTILVSTSLRQVLMSRHSSTSYSV